MNIWPDGPDDLVHGAWGAAVWGLFSFAALALAGHWPDREAWTKLGVNIVCAVLVGAVMSWFLTGALVELIPIAALKDSQAIIKAVGFGVGLFGWELLPFLFLAARNLAKREADKQTGGGQ